MATGLPYHFDYNRKKKGTLYLCKKLLDYYTTRHTQTPFVQKHWQEDWATVEYSQIRHIATGDIELTGRKKWHLCQLLASKKTYSTGYSQAVTHPSTNPAQCCLISMIRREPVHSAWYGRRTPHYTDKHLLNTHWQKIGLVWTTFILIHGNWITLMPMQKRPTALDISRRSPIQVLTQPNAA